MCRKSGTHGFEAEVEGAIPPSTVTGSTSPSGSVWRQSGVVSPPCARAKTGCGSRWPCSTATTISVCPMRVYAGPCPSPSRPTAAAHPPSGGLVHRPWRRGSPTMSGRCVRCCSFASRRGHSQQGGEQALVGSVRRGDQSRRCVSARPASRLSPGVRGLLGCHESSLVYTFLFLWWSTDEPEIFTRSGQVHDRDVQDEVKDPVIAQFVLWSALGYREVRQEKCLKLGSSELDRNRCRCRRWCRSAHHVMALWEKLGGGLDTRITSETTRG